MTFLITYTSWQMRPSLVNVVAVRVRESLLDSITV